MKHFSKGLFLGAVFGALTMAAPQLQAATPQDQLVIGTSLAQVLSLDPQQATEGKAVEIMSNLYDRLVASTADGKIIAVSVGEHERGGCRTCVELADWQRVAQVPKQVLAMSEALERLAAVEPRKAEEPVMGFRARLRQVR